MLSIACLLIFIGFHVLYNTSKRAQLNSPFLYEGWVRLHHKKSKLLGFILIGIGFVITLYKSGVTAGILLATIILMTIASLVVLLGPIKHLGYKIVVVSFIFFFALELLTSLIYAS